MVSTLIGDLHVDQYIIFTVESANYAIDLSYIDSVVPAVELSPMMHNNENILGLLNLHGTMVPVLDLRKYIGNDSRQLKPSDQMIICRKESHRVAFSVDKILGLKYLSSTTDESELSNNSFTQAANTVVQDEGKVYFILCIDALIAFEVMEQSWGDKC